MPFVPRTPSPDPTAVITGAAVGPTLITFVTAEPPPGSTLTGCGSSGSGCDGRIRMRFRLRNPTGGQVLDAIGFLHTTSMLACWRGTSGPFRLEPGATTELLVVFDRREPACAMPATIATMKLVVSGTIEVDARQEWAIHYELRP